MQKKILLIGFGVVILAVVVILIARSFLETKRESKPGEFSNGQKYSLYSTDDFEVKYPSWPNVDSKNLLSPQTTKLAVTNEGCNFVINVTPVPQNTTFKEYAQKRLEEQKASGSVKVTLMDIKDKTSHFEGEIIMGGSTLTSTTYSYLSSKGQSYEIGFISEKSKFNSSCKPLIKEVVASVKVK